MSSKRSSDSDGSTPRQGRIKKTANAATPPSAQTPPPPKKTKKSPATDPSDLTAMDAISNAVAMQGQAFHSLFGELDFSNLILKPDHVNRPIWVCPDGTIFLETFSPLYKHAYDFLITIAEPVSRPHIIHEYRITPYSLYAAVSVGLVTNDIISVLDRLSKVKLHSNTLKFIRECTSSYGKVKLVLHKNRFFVESLYPDVLTTLLQDNQIREHRLPNTEGIPVDPKTGFYIRAYDTSEGATQDAIANRNLMKDISNALSEAADDDDDELAGGQATYFFEIDPKSVESTKKRCIEIDYPMLEEYDFRNDTINPNLEIDLKPTTRIRPYQEKSLSKTFGNGRARSGIIVLPCGAGKTLVGITATCTVKKSTLVLCTSGVSVEQWRNQYKMWSTIDDKHVARFTSTAKERCTTESCLVITTYNMVAFGGHRSDESTRMIEEIRGREWGLMVLDEVHVVPAQMFRKVVSTTASHCKLGLTATLLREDNLTEDLNFLIGPKLYEANWMDLQKAGHLATVKCFEVWCPMTAEFYAEYLKAPPSKKKLLYVMNPNKYRACEFLINYHEKRGDKILVFSDNVNGLKEYAIGLKRPFIYGPTSNTERMNILRTFQSDSRLNTIFISKVGDTSIDLPEATVIIQISSHYGSRRQEAQRLGRILRSKKGTDNTAYFYSLVSQDTQEMYYSSKRQQFLVNQGYQFRVLTNIVELANQDPTVKGYATKDDQLKLLAKVLVAEEEGEKIQVDDDDVTTASSQPVARRTAGNIRNLTGADDLVYTEYKTPGGRKVASAAHTGGTNGATYASQMQRHPLFRKRYAKK